jgi:hypothetical protein
MMPIKKQVSESLRRAILEGGNYFTCDLIKLIAKADPENLQKIRKGFPIEVAAWEAWTADPDELVPDLVEISVEQFNAL